MSMEKLLTELSEFKVLTTMSATQHNAMIMKLNQMVIYLNNEYLSTNPRSRESMAQDPCANLTPDDYLPLILKSLPNDMSFLNVVKIKLEYWGGILHQLPPVSAEMDIQKLSSNIFQFVNAITRKLGGPKNAEYGKEIFKLDKLFSNYEKDLKNSFFQRDKKDVLQEKQRMVGVWRKDILGNEKLSFEERLNTFIKQYQKDKVYLDAHRNDLTNRLLKGVAVILASIFGLGIGGVYVYSQFFKKPRDKVFIEKMSEMTESVKSLLPSRT